MCILCQGSSDEFSVDHMREQLKNFTDKQRKEKALELKQYLKIVKDLNLKETIDELMTIQYLLSQYM